jgi:hypothetical protein
MFYPNSSDDSDDDDDELKDEMNPDDIGVLDDSKEEPTADEDEEESVEVEEDSNPTTVEEETEEEPQVTTRSGRVIRPPEILNMHQCHLQAMPQQEEQYSLETAKVIAMTICHMNEKFGHLDEEEAYQFVQSYSLKKGIQEFGERGKKAATKEMKQLHDRTVFQPIHVQDLTADERNKAMESLIFLVEKGDGSVKGRTCANGSTQRKYMDRDEAASPMASTESILITATIDAKQNRDIMTADIPNAFVQTDVDKKNYVKGERLILKARGPIVDMLLDIATEVYTDFVTYERGSKIIYLQMLKALYSMLQASLLYYKKF